MRPESDMRRMVILCFLLLAEVAGGQTVDEMEKIMAVSGVTEPQEMDEDEVERLMHFLRHRLKINVASVSSMMESGLFSRYQLASLADYRKRTGNVMSAAELSMVDGFNTDFVHKLSPFISFDWPVASSQGGRPATDGDVAVRSGLKHTIGKGEETDWNCEAKFRLNAFGSLYFSASLSRPYDARVPWPVLSSASVFYGFRKIRATVVLGDFNARFGQGLVLWNGMSVGGLSSPSAFVRNPAGLTRTWSYSASQAMTGTGASFEFGRFQINAMLAVPGIKNIRRKPEDVTCLPAVNLGWYGGSGEVALTHYCEFGNPSGHFRNIADMKTSVSARWCIRGTDLFSEAAFDWLTESAAVLAGSTFQAGDNMCLAVMLRYYQDDYVGNRAGAVRSLTNVTNEYSASFSGDFNVRTGHGQEHSGTFSLDAAHFPVAKKGDDGRSFQVKSVAQWKFRMSEELFLHTKASVRYRTWGCPVRADIRTDFLYETGAWSFSTRLNALYGKALALLGYVEGNFRTSAISVYLRQGIFRIDNWDDRIYVYERDSPGSFNVPAYYGRGVWTAMTVAWRFAHWGKCFARASYTSYPLMSEEKRKPGKAGLSLYLSVSF